MNKAIISLKEKLTRDDRLYLLIMSAAFFLLMCCVHIGGDDSGSMHYENGTFYNYLQKTAAYFYTWSSRIFVNTAIFIFTDNRKFLWAVCMGLCMYMMLRAFYVLSDAGDIGDTDIGNAGVAGAIGNVSGAGADIRKMNVLFIAAMVMLYPYRDISTAGWIATSTTYFMPAAAGFYSLIPIKKGLNGEKYRWWECILYPAALLFGANNEQIMIVVLASYAAVFLYSLLQKKLRLFWTVQFILACGSCALVMLCPGNWQRKKIESIYHFPTWGCTAGLISLISDIPSRCAGCFSRRLLLS